jgi:membrane protein implicated in regulation of membrane protease activity
MEYLMLYIWLGIFVVCFIIEVSTFNLVTVWFCVGALVSLILSLVLPLDLFWVEILVFFVVSLLCLAAVRPLATKALQRKVSRSNIDEIVGKKCKITKDVTELEPGEAKLDGVIWTAIVQEGAPGLNKDDVAEVVAVNGNKLVVAKRSDKIEKL